MVEREKGARGMDRGMEEEVREGEGEEGIRLNEEGRK